MWFWCTYFYFACPFISLQATPQKNKNKNKIVETIKKYAFVFSWELWKFWTFLKQLKTYYEHLIFLQSFKWELFMVGSLKYFPLISKNFLKI
jgi:hypothetical protein